MIKTGVAFSQLFVQRDLRTTEEDVEAKAFKCLREGAGAKEEGELRFYHFVLEGEGRLKLMFSD